MSSETDAQKLEENAELMNKYSRQIGTYGVETMAKVSFYIIVVNLSSYKK